MKLTPVILPLPIYLTVYLKYADRNQRPLKSAPDASIACILAPALYGNGKNLRVDFDTFRFRS